MNSRKPPRANARMTCHRIGLPPTSTIGFGLYSVSSRRRVPLPPHKMTTGHPVASTLRGYSRARCHGSRSYCRRCGVPTRWRTRSRPFAHNARRHRDRRAEQRRRPRDHGSCRTRGRRSHPPLLDGGGAVHERQLGAGPVELDRRLRHIRRRRRRPAARRVRGCVRGVRGQRLEILSWEPGSFYWPSVADSAWRGHLQVRFSPRLVVVPLLTRPRVERVFAFELHYSEAAHDLQLVRLAHRDRAHS